MASNPSDRGQNPKKAGANKERASQDELMILKEILDEHVHLKRRVLDKIRWFVKTSDETIFDDAKKKTSAKKN